MVQDGSHVGGLDGEVVVGKVIGHEGEGAVVQHGLGVIGGMGGSLYAQVAKHGIRFPSAEELYYTGVDACAEESSGSSGTERAGGYFVVVNTGEVL